MTPPKDKLGEVAEKKAAELTDWLDDFCGHPLNQQGSIAVRETLRGIIIEGMLAALDEAKGITLAHDCHALCHGITALGGREGQFCSVERAKELDALKSSLTKKETPHHGK